MKDSIFAQRFLGEQRIAFVGASRDPSHFSRGLFREFARRGYDVVPVNPAVSEVEGRPCYARLQDVVPPVAAAFVITPSTTVVQVVRDGIAAGVRTMWLHRGLGPATATEEAVRVGREAGLMMVEGCPYMFFPKSGAVHRVHGFFHRVFGRIAA